MSPSQETIPDASGAAPRELSQVLAINRSTKAFSSYAVSLVSLPAGALYAPITTATPGVKAYTSVQVSETAHIELNSDLVFCNHSCDPSLIFDMERNEVRVVDERALKEGEKVTFFYPSTEWEMAQPFDCTCGTERCVKRISGAKDMDEEVLKRYRLNGHIERLLEQRRKERGQNGNANGHPTNGHATNGTA
ncbi:hypothetical protein P152DRAFT_183078 [Eremomyces bilateralis CBS 781.70]|uniref:SET domain-containing protein n=1 Tax=Eremomyces bilateralis CBS 781.70 TaxID=1392243 RepID=A0A6G1GBD7_9PEZI|nr:uncharacterized protein P152DRAFT_183078 [Eremomyces bilateralis CBS 781.70]KAF1815363.1 hypothetical protein P152DRAFT_183078 [Eremomyces bilateralis CBS 781.70]